MNILIAPDSFKGSISAVRAAEAIGRAVRRAWPDSLITLFPVADGGEGTVEAVCLITGAVPVKCRVRNPLGRPVEAGYAWLEKEKTAVIETAAASGLPLLAEYERNPARASSFGTGQLVLDALERGARHIVLGLGGSATVDAGTGLLEALGMRFLDKDGHELPGCGDMLGLVDNLDLSALHPRLFDVKLTLACDVRNPLLGKQGAVHVFGPQKGIRPEDLPRFENGMSSFADVVRKACGRDERETPGSGAAGGIAFTLRSLFGAEVVSGFEWIAALGKLEEKVARSHLVVTGEGSFDSQSLSGKVADGIGRIAAHAGVPVIVLTGRDREHRITLPERGLSLIFPIVDETMELSEAMAQAETLIERAAFRLFCALWLGGTLFAGIKRNNSCP